MDGHRKPRSETSSAPRPSGSNQDPKMDKVNKSSHTKSEQHPSTSGHARDKNHSAAQGAPSHNKGETSGTWQSRTSSGQSKTEWSSNPATQRKESSSQSAHSSGQNKNDRSHSSAGHIKDMLHGSLSKPEHSKSSEQRHHSSSAVKGKSESSNAHRPTDESRSRTDLSQSLGKEPITKNVNNSAVDANTPVTTKTSYKEYKERQKMANPPEKVEKDKTKDLSSRPGLFESVTEKSLVDPKLSQLSHTLKQEPPDPGVVDIGDRIEQDMIQQEAAKVKVQEKQTAHDKHESSKSRRSSQHRTEHRTIDHSNKKSHSQSEQTANSTKVKSEPISPRVQQTSKVKTETNSPQIQPSVKIKMEPSVHGSPLNLPKVRIESSHSPLTYKSEATCSPVAGSENKIVIKRESGLVQGEGQSPLKLKIKTSHLPKDQSPHKEKKHHSHSSSSKQHGEQKVPTLKISTSSSKIQSNDKHSKSSSRHGEATIVNKPAEGTNGRSELKMHINMNALSSSSKKHGDSKSERKEKHKKSSHSHRNDSPSVSTSRKRPYSPASSSDVHDSHKHKISKSDGGNLQRSSSNHSLVSMEMSDSGSGGELNNSQIEVPAMNFASSNRSSRNNSPVVGRQLNPQNIGARLVELQKAIDLQKASIAATTQPRPPLPMGSPPLQPPPPPPQNIPSLFDMDFLSDDIP